VEHIMSAPGPDEWAVRYQSGDTPWDLRGPHPELEARLERDPTLGLDSVGSALVPGCGRGHDALALARAGWSVTAVDYADGVSAGPLSNLPTGSRFVQADAFDIAESGFGLMFDHTFFCAVDPTERPRWGRLAQRVLAPGGQVISIVFPVGRPVTEGGPPHGMDVSDVTNALGDDFRLIEVSSPFRVGRRSWDHVWARWGREPVSSAGTSN
jgi:SAM-dependent methyltransferase